MTQVGSERGITFCIVASPSPNKLSRCSRCFWRSRQIGETGVSLSVTTYGSIYVSKTFIFNQGKCRT